MAKGNDARRSWRRAGLLVACMLATAVALLLASCGGSDNGGGGGEADAPPKQVVQVDQVARDRWTYARARFHEVCAGCHALADARATGWRFNLDRIGGISEQRARFAIAEGEPGMPAWRHVLSKREFEELVAYVSTVARTDERGDDGWLRQMRFRMAGEQWRPGDTR